ncbi:hypothetical protein QUB80_08355 [Chlorogloeopsis sp. ULAP01]|uniref:hypothetical protein n=1 Tax=Chlorogloeopsis sp. ULAP01 TaxID=3056483 RepID=UPI0025AB28E9|nr:hypothetical protein [Chlorogloeopsis sp. ULAP01]MDM9380716.1 hypothetical protein [Chlorogloeopsis sp. ULAP01]
MMIFMLASGYLLTVYLLIALAKRAGKKSTSASAGLSANENYSQEASVQPKVTEISSVR